MNKWREERLTDNIGLKACDICEKKCKGGCLDVEWAIEKLQYYEDLSEQGKLIELPCKVGDIVYTISPRYLNCDDDNIEECNDYDSFVYLKTWCQEHCPNGYSGVGVIENLVTGYVIHKGDKLRIITSKAGYREVEEIFLTKEEAEKRLEELIYEDNRKEKR